MNKQKKNRRNFIKLSLLSGLASIGFSFKKYSDSIGELMTYEDHHQEINSNKDIGWIRKRFPLASNRYFFNLASHSVISNEVIESISTTLRAYATTSYSNRKPIEKCKSQLAQWLNTSADKIALTRNTTESVNIIARGLDLKAGDEIIISTHEHIGGASPWIALTKETGVTVKPIDLDLSGEKNLELLKKSVSSKTKVVYLSHVTCTTGLCLPAKDIASFCRENNIISCIDGAQAIGMISVDIDKINPDFYVGCGHKWLLGPKGTGILYAKNPNLLSPVFVGSYSDATFDIETRTLDYRKDIAKLEYGTRDVSLLAGLTTSIQFLTSIGINTISEHSENLAEYFRTEMSREDDIAFLSPRKGKYNTSILTFHCKTANNKQMVKDLSLSYNIMARWVYECDLDAIRISFSILNSKEEVDRLVQAINELKEKN